MTSILKVDTIQDADGNNIINESGNTITIGASGDTTNIIGTLQNDGSAVGGTNTPAFSATMSGAQSFSNSTSTKVQFDTEQFDTASAYDHSSNYRFTVPSGQAGKYFIYAKIFYNDQASTDANRKIHIYKNGSNAGTGQTRTVGTTGRDGTVAASQVYDLSVGDYIEIYLNSNAGAGSINGAANNDIFGGFKIIE